jgi:hypothetical protein
MTSIALPQTRIASGGPVLACGRRFSRVHGTLTPAGALAAATSHRSFDASTQPRGITTSVSIVETRTPEAREIAIPWKIGSVKMTLEPATRASAVIRMGRVLVLHARITDSATGTPFCTS